MGLLTEYIRRQDEKAREERDTRIKALASLLSPKNDEVTPQGRQWAFSELMKTSKVKGPVKELFEGMAKPAMKAADVISGHRKRMSQSSSGDEAKAPQVFFTPEQMEERRKRAADEEFQRDLRESGAKKVQELQLKAEQDRKDFQAKMQMIQASGLTETQKQQAILNLWGVRGDQMSAHEQERLSAQRAYNEKHGKPADSPVTELQIAEGHGLIEAAKKSQAPKDDSEPAEVKTQRFIVKQQHPEWTAEQVNKETAKKVEEIEKRKADSQRLGITLKQEGVEEKKSATDTAPKKPEGSTRTPIERLDSRQKDNVETAQQYLAGTVSLGLGGSIRQKVSAGLRIIQNLTGVTQEELDARSEVRKAAKKSYDRIKLITANAEGLERALSRHGDILTGIRSKLPQSDVKLINEWLISGAREFNVKNVTPAAIQYGLALQAVRNEYGRIIAGGAASVAQTPVEALHEAGRLMSEGFNSANTKAMVDQLKTETEQRRIGYTEQLQSLLREVSSPLVPELYGKKYGGDGQQGGKQGNLQTITTKDAFDKLPKGAHYLDRHGNEAVKE